MPRKYPPGEWRVMFQSRSLKYHQVCRCAKISERRPWNHLAKTIRKSHDGSIYNTNELGNDRCLTAQDETYDFFF